jgi:uncharacterized protein (UPF0335 family)
MRHGPLSPQPLSHPVIPNCIAPEIFVNDTASAIPPVTSEAATTTDQRLRLFIERVERLEVEKKAIGDDIRDVYAEAKATGYDAKIMRQIVRLRKMQPNDRREMEAILDTYKAALGID